MTLPKKNSRTIEVDAMRFRYILSTSATDDAGRHKLNLTVQIENGGGCLLKAEGIVTRERWLDFPGGESSDGYLLDMPRHVEGIIREARTKGWIPEEHGRALILHVPSALE